MIIHLAPAVVAAVVFTPAALAEERSFDSGGVTISYHDRGEGEAVVLLHGFTGSAEEMWLGNPLLLRPLGPELAKEFRVIAVDLRGHGDSGKPHDPKKYGREMVEDVVRLLDHLEIEKAHVVGYSLGAMVAGKLLVTHPDRLLSVTFGGAGPLYNAPESMRAVMEATAEALEQGKGIGPLVVFLMPEGQPKPSLEQAAAMSRLFLRGKDQKALAALLRGSENLEVTAEQLEANKVPVQFVYGSKEKELKSLIQGSKKLLDGAAERVVEGGDHVTTIALPAFHKAVVEFLRDHRTPEGHEPVPPLASDPPRG